MRKIRFYYAKLPNMGDLINPLVVNKIFGLDSKRHTFLTGELSAIGSGLENYLLSKTIKIKIPQLLSSLLFKEVHIWGTGFIREDINESYLYKRNTIFHALRGKLSKEKIEKIIGKQLDIPVGDVGLLADCLIDENPEKIYQVGIIPHFREQDDPMFSKLKENYNNSTIIDLTEDPIEVIKKIASCETILSSSLHGLIVADSFGIPNQHIYVSNNLKGDGFKFRDYYSAYNMNHEFIDLQKSQPPKISSIIQNYKMNKSEVDTIKKDLIHAFPFQ